MFSTGYQMFFIVGFLVYIVVMTLIGYLTTRGKTEGENFLTGGKQLSVFLLLSTIGATTIGTGTSISATANGYLYGWGGSIFGFGLFLGLLLMTVFTPVRKHGFNTMVEEAQFYYGGGKLFYYVMAVMMFLVEMIWVGNHINGGAKYLSYVTGINENIGKFITVLAFAAFSFCGGYLSVVWTDMIQFFIILIGFATVAIRAVPTAGGFAAIRAAYELSGNSGAMSFYGLEAYGYMAAAALLCSSIHGVIAVPAHHMRVYTAKDDLTAKKAFRFNSGLILAFSVVPSVIGMSAFAISQARGDVLATADFAFSYLATVVLGPVLGLIFLIAGLSATLSSADSDAVSGVTILISDLYPAVKGRPVEEKDYKKLSRIALAVSLTVAFLLSLYAKDVIGYINNVVGSLLPGLGVCMLMGRFWKRATWQGGLASVLTGVVFALLYLNVAPFQQIILQTFGGPAIVTTLLALIIGVAVSLCTPADTMTDEEKLNLIRESRGRKTAKN